MKTAFSFLPLVLAAGLASACAAVAADQPRPSTASAAAGPVIAIHGGAGTILRAEMSVETEAAYREALEQALRTGWAILDRGGSALDAVEAAVRLMEDSPLFNAGRGAVFTSEGRNELDASIMDGRSGGAGAVAGVTILKNPISAARAVMEKSPHVMMSGRGAELFATQQGLEVVDPSWFWTERRWQALQRALTQSSLAEPPPCSTGFRTCPPAIAEEASNDHKFGTVGAVALDRDGNLAAATSTGGMTNKKFGRIGDSPIIGAGTYAENGVAAISATGHGEFFIRNVVAYDIAALMKYRNLTLAEAGDEVINKKLKAIGGEGGVIAVDRRGNVAAPFNTPGMYRGWIGADGKPVTAIFQQ